MEKTFTNSAKRAVLAGLVAIGCAFATSSAMAGSGDEIRTQRVSTRGLDLSSPEVVETVYRRIRSAAKALCRDSDVSPWANIATHRCINATVSDAVANADIPLLTELHNKTNPQFARN